MAPYNAQMTQSDQHKVDQPRSIVDGRKCGLRVCEDTVHTGSIHVSFVMKT
jgi:hypothetical protein